MSSSPSRPRRRSAGDGESFRRGPQRHPSSCAGSSLLPLALLRPCVALRRRRLRRRPRGGRSLRGAAGLRGRGPACAARSSSPRRRPELRRRWSAQAPSWPRGLRRGLLAGVRDRLRRGFVRRASLIHVTDGKRLSPDQARGDLPDPRSVAASSTASGSREGGHGGVHQARPINQNMPPSPGANHARVLPPPRNSKVTKGSSATHRPARSPRSAFALA